MNSQFETFSNPSAFPESRPIHAKIMSAVRERGWLSTAFCGSLYLLRRVQSFCYDLVHGVSTRHGIPVSKLDLAGESAAHALDYEATHTGCLRRILRSLNIQHEHFEFVDLGSGKGRSLLIAAEFPFRRVWGSELSPTLSEIARGNCKTIRTRARACKNFEILCGDAADFSFPPIPLVIYLFNPFDGVIVSRILDKLKQSWEENPREIFVVYHHPVHGHLLESSPVFEPFLSGTDKWDYRKLRYHIFRTRNMASHPPEHVCWESWRIQNYNP